MLNIVIPMAGRGERFSKDGYTQPKPLIPIHDIPMIAYVFANIRPSRPHRWILLCQQSHLQNHNLAQVIKQYCPAANVIPIVGITEGAACTVLEAQALIDNDQPLMIANCDQYIGTNIDDYLSAFDNSSLDGLIMTMTASDNKWSYARTDSDGIVTEVAEKQIISSEATTGIYNFISGHKFVRSAKTMISKQSRVNGEFYVAPVYNEMISQGDKIGIYNIGDAGSNMHGLGVPSDLEAFIKNPASLIAREALSS